VKARVSLQPRKDREILETSLCAGGYASTWKAAPSIAGRTRAADRNVAGEGSAVSLIMVSASAFAGERQRRAMRGVLGPPLRRQRLAGLGRVRRRAHTRRLNTADLVARPGHRRL
jgi:hypothetical protein